MTDTYETKRDAAADKFVRSEECIVADDSVAHEETFKAGADWARSEFLEVHGENIKLPPEGKHWHSFCREREWWIAPHDSWQYIFFGWATTNPPEDRKASLIHVIDYDTYEKLKSKLEIATGGLKEILHAGNLAMQGKWDDTEIMKDLAYRALVQLDGEK